MASLPSATNVSCQRGCSLEGGHPQLAQVAIQQGKLLARNLKALQKGKTLKPFRYKNLGAMATVGRNRAVAELLEVKMAGFFAWLMWLIVHLRSILGIRNKSIVFLNLGLELCLLPIRSAASFTLAKPRRWWTDSPTCFATPGNICSWCRYKKRRLM